MRGGRLNCSATHDERNLLETHAIYRDEKQLIQSVQQATEELETLFEADQPGAQA